MNIFKLFLVLLITCVAFETFDKPARNNPLPLSKQLPLQQQQCNPPRPEHLSEQANRTQARARLEKFLHNRTWSLTCVAVRLIINP